MSEKEKHIIHGFVSLFAKPVKVPVLGVFEALHTFVFVPSNNQMDVLILTKEKRKEDSAYATLTALRNVNAKLAIRSMSFLNETLSLMT